MKGQALFLGKKLVRLILLLIAVSILTFCLMELSPVDSAQAYIGGNAMKLSSEKREQIEEQWGLNESMPTRFTKWAGSVLKGDFGTSLIYKRPVLDVIGEKFKASLLLMISSWLLSGIIGFFLAVVAGSHQETLLDKGIKGYCYILMSTPTFWLCLLLIMVFSVWLGWFPVALGTPIGVYSSDVSTWDLLHHMILPMVTLSVIGIASITMHTREKMTQVMHTDYMLFAAARGETLNQRVKNHGIRNILLPFTTLQFLSFSELFAGTILAENVFSYPGLGQATVDAGMKGDIPLLMGIVIFSTIFVFTGNFIADVLYSFIDPRIRKGVAL